MKKQLSLYKDYKKYLDIFILGIAAAMPLALAFSTMSIWLKELGIDKTTIGLFSIVSMPYVLKFIWAPAMDGVAVFFLSKKYGLRKSWLIVTQIMLFFAILALSNSNPEKQLFLVALIALSITFISATQDIVIDAYRIEVFETENQATATSLYIYGYRVGLVISGAVVLIISAKTSFSFAILLLSFSYLFLALYSVFLTSSKNEVKKVNYQNWLKRYIEQPFIDFYQRTKGYFLITILFIISFKLGDAYAGVMTNPFILELGFSKIDIAYIVKIFGLAATLIGTSCGALLAHNISLKKSLLIAAIFQLLTNLIFCIQAVIGKNAIFLAITISAENFAGGVGTVIFVAYLSSLCNLKFSATQYALLAAMASIARVSLGASSGYLADNVNWITFFIITAIISLPSIILIHFLKDESFKKIHKKN